MKYLMLFFSILMAVSGQIFLKKGVSGSSLAPNLFSIVKTLFSPSVFIGFLIYVMSSILWLFVLQKFPLSIAYPSLALTYIIVIVLSTSVLNEPLTLTKIIGVFLIFIGVILINR